jgi:hypothetical protein
MLDVACWRTIVSAEVAWFVRRMVGQFGPFCDAIQVTEEPNSPDTSTGGDAGASLTLDDAAWSVLGGLPCLYLSRCCSCAEITWAR